MRKCIFWVAIIGLILTSCRSRETQWVLIKDDPSLNLFVEKNSIKHVSGGLVRAWVTFAFKEPKRIDESQAIRKALSYDEIDCTRRTVRIIQVIFYFTDGSSQSLPQKFTATGISPGSPGEFEYTYLCQK